MKFWIEHAHSIYTSLLSDWSSEFTFDPTASLWGEHDTMNGLMAAIIGIVDI